MVETAAAAYQSGQGNPEQQFVQQQQQYSYQAQATAPGGQQYYGAAGGVEQENSQERFEQHGTINQGGQDANYAQYSRSTVERGGELQAVGAGFAEQQGNAGLIQQYTGATGQLAQQQGPNGYKINFDPNPQIIRKNANDAVTYKQEVAVRYLRPPTPPPPGPLIIKEVSSWRSTCPRNRLFRLQVRNPSFTRGPTDCHPTTTTSSGDATSIDHSRTSTTATNAIGS